MAQAFPARSRSSSVSTTSSSAALPSFESFVPPRAPTTAEAEETVLEIPYLGQDVRLKVDAGPGCGGIAWPAGIVLSRYLAWRHSHAPHHLSGKTVVELGSGTGLVGIVAALLDPAAQVYATDQAPLLGLMKINAELNVSTPNLHVAEYDWGEIPTGVPVTEAEVILAADCVYFEPAFPLLVRTLCDLAPMGKDVEILFCWKKRRKADKRFFALLKKHFDSEVVEDDKPGERETAEIRSRSARWIKVPSLHLHICIIDYEYGAPLFGHQTPLVPFLCSPNLFIKQNKGFQSLPGIGTAPPLSTHRLVSYLGSDHWEIAVARARARDEMLVPGSHRGSQMSGETVTLPDSINPYGASTGSVPRSGPVGQSTKEPRPIPYSTAFGFSRINQTHDSWKNSRGARTQLDEKGVISLAFTSEASPNALSLVSRDSVTGPAEAVKDGVVSEADTTTHSYATGETARRKKKAKKKKRKTDMVETVQLEQDNQEPFFLMQDGSPPCTDKWCEEYVSDPEEQEQEQEGGVPDPFGEIDLSELGIHPAQNAIQSERGPPPPSTTPPVPSPLKFERLPTQTFPEGASQKSMLSVEIAEGGLKQRALSLEQAADSASIQVSSGTDSVETPQDEMRYWQGGHELLTSTVHEQTHSNPKKTTSSKGEEGEISKPTPEHHQLFDRHTQLVRFSRWQSLAWTWSKGDYRHASWESHSVRY